MNQKPTTPDTDDTEAADGTADDTAAAAEAEPGDTAVVDSAAPVIEDDSELGDAE